MLQSNVRWDSGPCLQYIVYPVDLLCPHIERINTSRTKLSPWSQRLIREQYGDKSLRQLAREYSVSYETVRRTIGRSNASIARNEDNVAMTLPGQ